MKVDLLRKFKWYIVGFIMIVIMLSVGLSFCAWDDLSVQALNAKANAGEYYDTTELNKYVTLVVDKNGNKAADVGDVVTFGRYYQNADDASTKTALRWIVVHQEGTTLTLLTEKVVAFGSFWGTIYYNSNNGSAWGTTDPTKQTYYQNYEQSTIRAWLNSTATRNDGGPQINGSGAFAGFYKEAFSPEEKEYIIPQNISGMRGAGKGTSTKENYNAINGDKVWIPSYTQVYGDNAPGFSATVSDGSQSPTVNSKFSYFSDNTKRIGKTTAFASSAASNYTWNNVTLGTQNWQNTSAGGAAWWWLRSPHPTYYNHALIVNTDGSGLHTYTNDSGGGVRPAVCVPL